MAARILFSLLAILIGVSTAARAGTIEYNFDDGNGVVDSNDFGSGVTAGDFTLTSSGGTAFNPVVHPAPGSDPKARVAARKATHGGAFMSFTVTIPTGVSVDLTGLSFEHGIDFNGASMTPLWSLAIDNGGSSTPASGDLGFQNTAGFFFDNETIALTGLTGLTDTTVTFTFDFTQEDRANSVNVIAHTMDDVVLTGTVSVDPNPPPSIISFTAIPTVVDPGDTVTLFWQTAEADTLGIDQGVGDVTGDVSTQVVVNAETTYTLTATNPHGTDTADTTVRMRLDTPNILLVLVDDMGTEDTSVDFNYDTAGNPVDRFDPTSVGLPAFTTDNRHFRTPTMATLAARGMKFTRAYACQVCSPTRASLLTGQNSARHGTIQYLGGGGSLHNIKAPPNPGLKGHNRTLAEELRDAGYRTIVAGKGHIGNSFNSTANNYVTPAAPTDDYYGFEVNVSASTIGQQGSCYSNASNAFGLSTSGTTGSFVAEYQNKTYTQLDPVTYPVGHPQANEPVFVTEALTREMNERIEASVAEGKPFFAYLSHFAVHDPHQPDPRFTANYPGLSGAVLDFATMIEGMDQSLGDVLAKLEELGVAEDTLVIFLGDNGSDSKPRGPQNPATLTMTNPLRGEKGMRYEGGIRVPLIVSWAKPDTSNSFQQALAIPAASREDDIVAVEDIFPTVLAACGVPVPTTDDNGDPLVLDGSDLGPYLRGTPGTHRPQQLVTHAPCSSRSNFFTTYHDGTWKLIYNYTTSSPVTSTNVPLGTYELYDLATDIHEANNLAASESDRVMSMARGMVAELERLGAPYPILKAADASLAALGLPSSADDPHPVILPALPGTDIDGDELDDNTEDPNRNGLVDPGETDPDNDNTDGDNAPDGAELSLGTDPLDPNSFFYLHGTPQPDNSILLTWPSQPGTNYEIRSSSDLADWSTMIAPDVPAADPGSTTTYNVPSSTALREFYRIDLK